MAVSSDCHLLAKGSSRERGRVLQWAWAFGDAHKGYGPVQGEGTHREAGPQGDRASPTRCPQSQTPPGAMHLRLYAIIF